MVEFTEFMFRVLFAGGCGLIVGLRCSPLLGQYLALLKL